MSLEDMLKSKQYFEQFLSEYKYENPMEVLGELLMEEQGKEAPELSDIRYAQGELYYHYKDFEAAIYKWENVNHELTCWAKKIWRMPMLSSACFLREKNFIRRL
ncbi:hypothetical protein [Robertmurraya massiliosenegalensis]|uniref:hypothetical protein n=1 Tax=Robertmurraya massiliosenegalensis TaxID=1287657 RepID=UPI0002D66D1C|nr:hypothetical protein [Robertmurraya massiliosenegalensis]